MGRDVDEVDLGELTHQQSKIPASAMEVEEEEEPYEIVRPSQAYQPERQQPNLFGPTIVQTPILPCFASEMREGEGGSKRIREGEGVWRIGRVKVKDGRCQLKVGEFVFEGGAVAAEGKAGLVAGGGLHQLPQWQGMWVLQPTLLQ